MRVRTSKTKKVGDVTIVKTATVAGMRQMRCPKCHGMAGPAQDRSGKEIFVCGTCGARFSCSDF